MDKVVINSTMLCVLFYLIFYNIDKFFYSPSIIIKLDIITKTIINNTLREFISPYNTNSRKVVLVY
jgi:hypothetical protein